MDYDKLIEQLKKSADFEDYPVVASFAAIIEKKYLREAAIALSTLQAENEMLRAELEYEREHANAYHEECGQWEAENEKLRAELQKSENDNVNLTGELAKVAAELEQVKRERDAAVQCIKGIAKSGRVWMCPHCVHAKDTTRGIAECELDVGVCMMPYSRFEWRGQKKD